LQSPTSVGSIFSSIASPHSGGRWRIWWQIHQLFSPVSVNVSAYFCCKTWIYMACHTSLLLECICHPIRFSFAICLRICQIRPKGLFFHKAYRMLYLPTSLPLAVVSAFVSAIYHKRLAEHFRICLCICHLPQTTGRTLSDLPLYLPSTTNDWQNSLFACPFIIFIKHGSSSLSRTVIVRVHTRTESSFPDGTSPSPE
jgi:hypothetical protein